MHTISNLFYFGTALYMFRTLFPSIIRSLRLCIQLQSLRLHTVLDSWWWKERTSETCRDLFQNKINLRYCASGWFYYRNLCLSNGLKLCFLLHVPISSLVFDGKERTHNCCELDNYPVVKIHLVYCSFLRNKETVKIIVLLNLESRTASSRTSVAHTGTHSRLAQDIGSYRAVPSGLAGIHTGRSLSVVSWWLASGQ
jgi:hypothetical protein